jgi:hypothetical protein
MAPMTTIIKTPIKTEIIAPPMADTGRPHKRVARDHHLASFKTRREAIKWAQRNGHAPYVDLVRHLNDQKKPDHWRAV